MAEVIVPGAVLEVPRNLEVVLPLGAHVEVEKFLFTQDPADKGVYIVVSFLQRMTLVTTEDGNLVRKAP